MRLQWWWWVPVVVACQGPAGGSDGDDGDDGSSATDGTNTDETSEPVCDPVLSAPFGDLASGLVVEADPAGGPVAERLARLRSVSLTGGGVVTVSGPFELLTPAGDPIASGAELADQEVWIRATATGAGTLDVAPIDGCAADAVSVSLTAVEPVPIAVRALDGFPWAERFDLFGATDTVSAWIDVARYPDRLGLEADLYVVPHRGPAGWAADRGFGDAVAGPVSSVVPAGAEPVDVWSGLPSDGRLATYDLVVDFGRDGQLDPGDLLDGLDAPGFVVAGKLSNPGPFTPVQFGVSQSFWVTMRVYYPEEVDALGPMPLVVISHGNGHDYTWYDYLGNHLASYGYVVISHRNDTGPGPVTAAATTLQNTDAFLAGLSQMEGGVLEGEVDPHQIAWIGHSRGGEGVVIAYDDLFEGDAVPTQFVADDVRLVSSIAPTVFENPQRDVNPHGVTYHLMAGSLDGDVTGGVESEILQYLRIFQNSTGLSAVTYVEGADHNDFNCCGANDANWGAGGPGVEIGRNRAQQLAKSYYLALLEATFRPGPTNDLLWEYLARAPENFRPDDTEVVVASQLKRPEGRFVIDDFQENPEVDVSSSGGAVTRTVRELVEDVMDDRNGQLQHDPGDPMNGMSQSENDANPARGIVFEWDATEDDRVLEFEIPAAERDLTDDAFVSFRACQGTRHPNTTQLAGMASFSIALVDGAGNVSAIDHRVYGGIPTAYRRNGGGNGTGWVNEFQSFRVPIDAFAWEGRPIDLSDVVAVRFLFGASHGSAVGRIGLDDLELLAPSAPGAP